MKGYKAFDENLQCRGFQYEVGKTYEIDGELIICKRGFHFCKGIAETYNYYQMDEKTRICEVEAIGEIVSDGTKYCTKYCTNKIRIVREVDDWQRKGNVFSANDGYMNTGKENKGNYNTGYENSGNFNSGNFNSGIYNSGDRNTGHRNSGDENSGGYNSGNWNIGDKNTGDRNIGDNNTGNNNLKSSNTGSWNLGCYNSGDYNSGDYNSGDWNLTSWSSGCFNTETQKITMFDRPTDWTMDDWRNSMAYRILTFCPSVIDVKKKKFKKKYVQNWWNNLPEDDRQTILDLPNFDAEKFKKCTGIKVKVKSSKSKVKNALWEEEE